MYTDYMKTEMEKYHEANRLARMNTTGTTNLLPSNTEVISTSDGREEYYVLIAGSRSIDQKWYGFIESLITADLRHLHITPERYRIIIVSGGASSGPDQVAEIYANKHQYRKIIMYANWDKYGKSAGFRRNEQMHILLSDKPNKVVLCYKDKYSQGKGTTHSISLGIKYKNDVVFHTLDFEEMIDAVNYYQNQYSKNERIVDHYQNQYSKTMVNIVCEQNNIKI